MLDAKGNGIPKILQRLKELKEKYAVGPIAVFSAPIGCTDELIRIGEAYAQSAPASVDPVFRIYTDMAKRYIKGEYLTQALTTLVRYKAETVNALTGVNKRFTGNVKAKVLTHGGELAMSTLIDFIMKSSGVNSSRVAISNWPVVTDDNFEQATPIYELSKKRLNAFIDPLEAGKTVSMAGFLGVTSDGLDTVLGRGGSDLTAVFAACLLKAHYSTEILLFKDVPVQSADPKVVKGQVTKHVDALTYNEAQYSKEFHGYVFVTSKNLTLPPRCVCLQFLRGDYCPSRVLDLVSLKFIQFCNFQVDCRNCCINVFLFYYDDDL